MNQDGTALSDITQQLDALARQMDELTRTAVLWMVVSVLLIIFLIVVLVVLMRMRARNRKVERWMVSEARTLQTNQEAVMQRLSAPVAAKPARPAPQVPRAQQMQQAPPPQRPIPTPAAPEAQRQAAQPQPKPQPSPQPQPQQAPMTGGLVDLVSTLNELLAGNQPYNFIEAVRAIDPRLTLQRLAPRVSDDTFAKEIYLDQGGDGLFAVIDGDTAQLYPNYSRFSATLDPKPLYEGARHGGRIHAILQPALLSRQSDGAWLLAEKGQVQMRQGA